MSYKKVLRRYPASAQSEYYNKDLKKNSYEVSKSTWKSLIDQITPMDKSHKINLNVKERFLNGAEQVAHTCNFYSTNVADTLESRVPSAKTDAFQMTHIIPNVFVYVH